MPEVCDRHNLEFSNLGFQMENIQKDISDINKKLDRGDDTNSQILKKLEDLTAIKVQVEYIEKNINEHKANPLVHLSKWWVIATVLGTVLVGFLNIQGCSFI